MNIAEHSLLRNQLYYRIIVLFAGERIFKIGTHLAKLQAKWFDCFTCPVCYALSCLKVQLLPDNLHMMDKSRYQLSLFEKQSNSDLQLLCFKIKTIDNRAYNSVIEKTRNEKMLYFLTLPN